MASVFDLAAYVLAHDGAMDAMRLQRLCYYAQAWSLAWRGVPLYGERIEAWAAGPVVADLFAAHRGRYHLEPGSLPGNAGALTETERGDLNFVLRHYKAWTASQLSDLAQREAPWANAREGLAPHVRGDRVIEPEVMAVFYRDMLTTRPPA